MARFLIVVLVGLALNTALVWCFVYPLAIQPTVAKIGAVPIVLIWNYLGRRMLVFNDRVPVSVQSRVDGRRARWPASLARACQAQRANGQAMRSRSTSARRYRPGLRRREMTMPAAVLSGQRCPTLRKAPESVADNASDACRR